MSFWRSWLRKARDWIAKLKADKSGGPKHLKLGKLGEDLAVNALKERGYRIAERNFIINRHEIDIIAVDGEFLVFVEVKTRSDKSYGPPMAAITPKVVARLKKAAQMYTMKKKLTNAYVRFDVVTVDYADGDPKVEIVRNAF
ncbi:MAG: YraN family protein [Nitrospinae bacterium]|nr:YraN family protein [Nitrospinota bacterium]